MVIAQTVWFDTRQNVEVSLDNTDVERITQAGDTRITQASDTRTLQPVVVTTIPNTVWSQDDTQ